MPSWKIQGLGKMAEEVGHNHVTAYVIVELYGFSMELPVQFWPSSVVNKQEMYIVGIC